MDMKMRQQTVPLQCGVRNSCGFHVMEHLGENSKIVAWTGKGHHTGNCPNADEQEKCNCAKEGPKDPNFFATLFMYGDGLYPLILSKQDIVNHPHKNQKTCYQEGYSERCDQCRDP